MVKDIFVPLALGSLDQVLILHAAELKRIFGILRAAQDMCCGREDSIG